MMGGNGVSMVNDVTVDPTAFATAAAAFVNQHGWLKTARFFASSLFCRSRVCVCWSPCCRRLFGRGAKFNVALVVEYVILSSCVYRAVLISSNPE